jgi:hypothetical protein
MGLLNTLLNNGGGSSNDASYTTAFTNETSPLNITHNLGKRPSVVVIDENEEEVVVDLDYDAAGDSLNVVTLIFSGTLTGRVICN